MKVEWRDPMRWVLTAAIVASTIVAQYLFIAYITAEGLELRIQTLRLYSLNLPVPVTYLATIGIVLVALTSWLAVNSAYTTRRPGDVEAAMRLGLIRAAIAVFWVFSLVLFLPYLIGSAWSWSAISFMSSRVPQIRDAAVLVLERVDVLMTAAPLGKYVVSENLSAIALVLAAFFIFRRRERIRKLR